MPVQTDRGPALPEPFYFGIFGWAWRRLIGWRDRYGRPARFIGWRH